VKRLYYRSPNEILSDVSQQTKRSCRNISVIYVSVGTDVGVAGHLIGNHVSLATRYVCSSR